MLLTSPNPPWTMKLSECSPAEREALALLEQRIGRTHLHQRLGLEGEHEVHVHRRGTHFLHIENWYSVHGLIRGALRLGGLHGRGQRNALALRTVHNAVRLRGLPSGFEGYTLLHLSDLHLDASEDFLNQLVAQVQGLKYHACVLTGDFRFRTFGAYQPTLNALARLRPHLGAQVYAVLGNHDTIRMVPGMEALGIRVLMNEAVRLQHQGDKVALVGIDDAHYFRTHNFHKALEGVEAGACAILLSHTPEPYRHAAHAGLRLMLCGHTHGGQICLPTGVPIITDSDAPRSLARGAWQHQQMLGYTSVGCGTSIVDVRLNCPPEITLHQLHQLHRAPGLPQPGGRAQ